MIGPVAIAFDLDGTLVDTTEAHGYAYHLAFAKYGVAVQPSAFRAVAGMHQLEVIRILSGDSFEVISPVELHRLKTAHFHLLAPKLVRPLPAVALARLVLPLVPTALVTSASRETVVAALSSHIELEAFGVIVTGDDVIKHKPHPDPYLLAAELLGIQPGSLLVLEDSEIGLMAAQSAGCIPLRVGDWSVGKNFINPS